MIKSLLKIVGKAASDISRRVYAVYRVIAIAIGTIVMLLWAVASFNYFTQRAVLPNGFQLAPTNFDRNDTQLLDGDGTQVVTSVDEVMWCNDVIYGNRRVIVDHHPAVSSAEIVDDKIAVDSVFIYDGKAKILEQHETALGYYRGGIYEKRNLQTMAFNFGSELEKRKLPAFDYKKTVRYLDMITGLDNIPKDEICRTSNSRKPRSFEPVEE